MFDDDQKTIRRMTPLLQRVLIADPQPASARLVGELMLNIARSQIWMASTTDKALKLAENCNPDIIFVELKDGAVDGADFTKKLRRSTLSCRQTPVVMTTGSATAAGILAARDAGVHEFLRKPFTLKDLLRRLEAVTLRQRDWVEAVGYIGPDRRRFNSGDYTGALKRRSDNRSTPDAARIAQALKILRSAVMAVGSDPQQALRAMLAQAGDIQKAATAVSDLTLVTAATDFHRYLKQAASLGAPLSRSDLEKRAAPLLAYMPKDMDDLTDVAA